MPKERIKNRERDDFISNCISKGWGLRVFKVRPPLGKRAKKAARLNDRIRGAS